MSDFSRGREGHRNAPESTITIEHNAVVKNLGNIKSLRLAVNAMCFHCMGCTASHFEPGAKDEIRNCTAIHCPLWQFRPYRLQRGKGGVT